jgi:hypothetical protein
MKLECTVTQATNSGESLSITLKGRQAHDPDWFRDGVQDIEIRCSERAKRAFYLGRRVILTIEPR